jgi:hypothetical protein
MAVAPVVEALRDADLGWRRSLPLAVRWRCSDGLRMRKRHGASAEWRTEHTHGRSLRFAPLALLLLVIVALVWRLATPADTTVHSKLEGKPLPLFHSRSPCRKSRR